MTDPNEARTGRSREKTPTERDDIAPEARDDVGSVDADSPEEALAGLADQQADEPGVAYQHPER